MCSNVNSREMCNGKKIRDGEKRRVARSRNLVERGASRIAKKIRREREEEKENTRGRESVGKRERANAEEFKIKYCIKRKKVVSAFQKKN